MVNADHPYMKMTYEQFLSESASVIKYYSEHTGHCAMAVMEDLRDELLSLLNKDQ